MNYFKLKIGLLIFLFVSAFSYGQNYKLSKTKYSKEQKELFPEIEKSVGDEDFANAFKLLEGLYATDADFVPCAYYYGFAALKTNQSYEVVKSALTPIKDEKENYPEILFYLAINEMRHGEYDAAKVHLETYLKLDVEEILFAYQAKQLIYTCEHANQLPPPDSSDITITHLGDRLNTSAHEYVPLVSDNDSVMYFTYRGEKSIGGRMDESMRESEDGHYYEDIYKSLKKNDKWTAPTPVEGLNTKAHDAVVSISPQGNRLYTYRSSEEDHGDLYESVQDEWGGWTAPQKLNGDINSNHWEGSCTTDSNGTFIIFASDRPGGFGGRDLYISYWDSTKNEWGKAKNMGGKINTSYNEDTPFYYDDIKILFFSSEGHLGYGGYDIVFSERDLEGEFRKPENLGNKINTPFDERFYVVTNNGAKGYYSTNLMGGQGGYDIYEVTPGVQVVIPGLISPDEEEIVEQEVAFLLPKDPDATPYDTYKKILELNGDKAFPGMQYSVQVAAYRYPDNYKYEHLEGLPFYPPTKTSHEDRIYRFRMGRFDTMNEAEAYRQQCIKKGQWDAWIVGVYKGKIGLLREIIRMFKEEQAQAATEK